MQSCPCGEGDVRLRCNCLCESSVTSRASSVKLAAALQNQFHSEYTSQCDKKMPCVVMYFQLLLSD